MKRMNFYILSIITIGVLAGGCKKGFLDINQDPNNPTEAAISPDLALPLQLHNAAALNASRWDFVNRWMGYWSASHTYSPSSVEWSYNINNDFGSGIWNDIYYNVSQLKSIERKSKDLGWKFYEGISMLIQAYQVGALVDVYGNVPYSTAWDLSGNIRPAYDKAEDIYKSLMARVDSGMVLINDADGTDKNIATTDIVFKGDKAMWTKFGNTLKLRLLIHTVNTSTFNAASVLGSKTAADFLGDGLSANVQPGYTADKPNPYYNAHFFSIAGGENDNYNRANNFVLNIMKGLNDERYKRLFRETKATDVPSRWRGTDYGSVPPLGGDLAADRTSGVGYGITANATVPMWLLTSVEAMFLRAEAIARGWVAGDALIAYRDAVKASFSYLGVTSNPDSTATVYLAQTDSRIAWPAAGSVSQKVAVIAWQKYFALTGIQANETWTDVRRLGVVQPALSVFEQRGNNPIPIRLLYPSSEYSYNKDNVNAEGTISQFTSKIFWDN